MKRSRGAVLWETLLLLGVVMAGVYWHQEIVRKWNREIKVLQEKRLPYDGERLAPR